MDASRYRVVRRIGIGGMAEVLEAVAVGAAGFERRVALKRMLPHEGDAEREHRMFLDEARIASHLHHANIVAVLDYGLADGRPFQVLEYVDGIDVRGLLARGPLPIELALHITLAVGHALDHAHGATDAAGQPLGIVHRDVTPANILVSRAGDVKLTDFGIAFAHAKTEHTLVGTTKGTPWFMSPEQMMGDATDARSDGFSLGCVLHTMVTGSSPLERPSQQIHVANGAELELASEVPADVRAIIERATRHNPTQRYASTRELVAALAAVTARYPVVDPRTALREWVEAIDGRVSQPPASAKPGKLDGLLDLALLLDGSGPREFQTVSTPTSPERPALLESALVTSQVPTPRESELVTKQAPPRRESAAVKNQVAPRRRSRATIVALVATAVLAVGIAAFMLARRLGEPDAVAAAPRDDGVVAVVQEPVVDGPVREEPMVSPDAAVALVTPLDAAVADAKRPSGDKKKSLPPPNAATQRWIRRHGRAASTFASWMADNPEAAVALRAWEAKTGQGNALLTWLTENIGSTVGEYASTHPRSGLGAITQRFDLTGIRKWVRKHQRQTTNLARDGGGFPWP